jgi:iron complex outermembrane receptor protein
VALSWQRSASWSAFASYAYASREPALRDLYDGETVGNVPLYGHIDQVAGVYDDPLVRPEHVNDYELGGSWHAGTASLTANLFHMDFRDELVFAGQFDTDLGYPITGNAARSVHQGVELAGAISRRLDRGGFSPERMANAGARASWKGVSARVEAQYAGRVFVDNTGTDLNSIAPHTVWNGAVSAAGHVAGARTTLTLRGFNLGDLRYATTGYMDFDSHGALVPTLMPAATRSFLLEARVDW